MDLKIFIKKNTNELKINGKKIAIPKGQIIEKLFYYLRDLDLGSITKVFIKSEKGASILSKRIFDVFKKTIGSLKSLESK